MILTKEEFIGALQDEIRLLLHLISKVEPSMLDYRPTPEQRSLLQLLQYLSFFGPLHLKGTLAPRFDGAAWGQAFREEQPRASARDLEEIKQAIGAQSGVAHDLLTPYPDAELRADFEMFGQKASRGLWLVRLVLNHYAAYRMQLFLYLKACGRPELNTMNLWVGTDAPMTPPV